MEAEVPEWFESLSLSNSVMTSEWEDLALPDSLSECLPEELRNAKIKRGNVQRPRDSLRLNGPPGTGKTTQICLRLMWLIDVLGVSPSEITVVTYRRSLADVVQDRLKSWDVIEEGADLTFWSTAHAVANRACGVLENAKTKQRDDAELGPAVGAREKAFYCREVLDIDYSASQWEDAAGELLFKVFDWCANNEVDLDVGEDAIDEEINDAQIGVTRAPAFDDLIAEWPGVDVISQYRQWQEFLERVGWVQFHEMLEIAADPLSKTPPTEVVIIDEYHDAYPLLASVCEHWEEEAETAIVAGDPLQVVNSFSGADPSFFDEGMAHLPELLLDTSFRVPETIWQAATRMLRPEHSPPTIERTGERGEILEHVSPPFATTKGTRIPGSGDEGSPPSIAEEYVLDDNGNKERDMLMLARTRQQVRNISQSLSKEGIVHEAQQLSGVSGRTQQGSTGWSGKRLELLNALLKILDVPASFSSHGSGQQGIVGFERDAGDIELSLREAAALLEHSSARDLEISADARDDQVEEWRKEAAKEMEENDGVGVRQFDELVSEGYWSDYGFGSRAFRTGSLIRNGFDDDAMRSLREAVQRYDSPLSREEVKQVRVMTIHASKGSEATDCVVYDGITSRIQSEMRQSHETRENESRSWYVAFSRASSRLHIVRGGWTWTRTHVPKDMVEVARRRADEVLSGSDDGAGGGDEGGVSV